MGRASPTQTYAQSFSCIGPEDAAIRGFDLSPDLGPFYPMPQEKIGQYYFGMSAYEQKVLSAGRIALAESRSRKGETESAKWSPKARVAVARTFVTLEIPGIKMDINKARRRRNESGSPRPGS